MRAKSGQVDGRRAEFRQSNAVANRFSILRPLSPAGMQITGQTNVSMINWAIPLSSFAIDLNGLFACHCFAGWSDSPQYGQTV